jgi:3-phenylpropionate/trans-cinnamate dioxygenase ferredoxin subunit
MNAASQLRVTGRGTIPGRDYIQLFRNYPDRDALLAKIRAAAFEGIQLFAGRDVRRRVEEAGLPLLHRYYPAEYVNLLQTYINEQTARSVIVWSAKIGRESIGIEDDFHVQDLVVVRLHYPHNEPAAKVGEIKGPSLVRRLRWGFGARSESVKAALASRTVVRRPRQMLKYLTQRKKREQELLPYRCHGPHLDSWLGQPIGSLSVWLAVAGVEQDNSMCLYPGMLDQPLPQSTSLFLGSGRQLTKPTRPDIHDGDVYVFSTDILHSSQVNISGKTRFALTTRISAGTPVFDGSNLWFIERWHLANELLDGKYRCRTIKASEYATYRPPSTPHAARQTIRVNGELQVGELKPVAKSEDLPDGKRIVVEFPPGVRVMIFRITGRLSAFSARCPHGGYRLDDGWHDERVMACPGHGLEFDTQTGESKSACFRLPRFDVVEKNGTIYLAQAPGSK